jgi:hypothetical protein
MAGEEGVAAAIARITAAWMEQRWDDLGEQLHARMVVTRAEGRLEGRAAAVRARRELMERASVEDYRETGSEIDVFGATAVATIRWWMRTAGPAGPERHSGRDHYVLEYDPERGDWVALWQSTILEPPPAE